jgi:hypothetical protein
VFGWNIPGEPGAGRRLPVGTVKVNNVFGDAAEPRARSRQGFGFGRGLLDELTARKVAHIEAPQPT